MTTRFTPGKPFVRKVNGLWQVFIPQIVFGAEATGSWHGPCASWGVAVGVALAISGAMLRNVQAQSVQPSFMQAVN